MNPNIDIYLRSAFKELDAFAIPRVGTFRKVHRAAQVAPELGELHPPVLEIEFDPEVRDSLLLTSYLTNNIHMGKVQAEQIVSDISQTISHALKSRKKFEIAEIGSLRRSAEGKLSFSTSHQNRSIFADDYFGFQPIQYKSPVKSVEFEASNGLVEAMEETNVHETVASGSKGPLRIVAMLGLILMFGITLIYTVRTERASLAVRPPMPTDVEGTTYADNTDSQEIETPITPPPSSELMDENTSSVERNSDPVSMQEVGHLLTEVLNNEPPQLSSNTPPLSDSDFGTRGNVPSREEARQPATEADNEQGDFEDLVPNDNLQPKNDGKTYQDAPGDPHYYLIVGSYTNVRKAKEFVGEIKAKVESLSPIVLYPVAGSGRPYRVSIYHSTNKSQVVRIKNQIERMNLKEIESPWIYPSKAQ